MLAHDGYVTTWTEKGGDALQILLASDADVSGWTRIGYIGTPMILHGKTYDPDQSWLPFMQGAILRHPPGDHYYGSNNRHDPKWVKRLALRPIQIQDRHKKMFDYGTDKVDQHLLPFAEYRYVEGGEYSRAKWHWPLDSNNVPVWRHQLSKILVNMQEFDFIEWGVESFSGRFAVSGGFVYYEKEVDWLFTKLRFFGEEKIES